MCTMQVIEISTYGRDDVPHTAQCMIKLSLAARLDSARRPHTLALFLGILNYVPHLKLSRSAA